MKTKKLDIFINGKLIKKDFEVPEQFSERSATIIATRYAMDYENSALQIIDRVVKQITEWGFKQGYFRDLNIVDGESDKFATALTDILVNQRAAFNSPVWFNCGVPENSNQMSACFIFPVEDNMEDILAHTTREGIVFRSGSGAGVNVSKLRAKGEKLANKGEASGPISFMRTWDANAGSIRSGGKNRRSAKMVCMDIDHPDIEDFINCKKLEEYKARILVAGGIDHKEANETVCFQNTNHSIRVTNEFMTCVKDNKPWNLINRGDKQIAKTVNAKDLLKLAASSAYTCGDPGIQYHDRMNDDNPVPSMGEIRSTNPCAEFSAVDNSSCNLASFNLVKYMTNELDKEILNWIKFEEDINTMVTAMDILIEAADYPTPEVRSVTLATRPLGLGFSNLGAFLMINGYSYDSDLARMYASEITNKMTIFAYKASINLAKKLGSYSAFDKDKEIAAKIGERITNYNKDISDLILTYGLRNSQLTLLAPTGTISFMMDCDSTGIEPLFALKSYKTLVDGSTMELEPKCVEIAKSTWGIEKEDLYYTAQDLPWKAHIDMMAACQPYINGAISKTVNMSKDCTDSDIFEAYVYAWEKGLKAVTIYRDGSKLWQPLSTKKIDSTVQETGKNSLPELVRRRLPDERPAINHKFDISGFECYINAGMFDDKTLGELFITASKSGSSVQGLLDSLAIAVSIGVQYGVPLEAFVEKFIETRFEPSGFTSNKDIQISKSPVDYIFRWLERKFINVDRPVATMSETPVPKKLTAKADNSGPPCSVCGSITHRVGTCFLCSSCGSSSGCS